MHSAVAHLSSLMTPPPLPPVVPPPWAEVEHAMGMALPTDYRDFIDLYGDGRINGALSVFFPARRAGPHRSLTVLADNTAGLRDNGFFDEFDCRRIDSSNLLLWGQTLAGDLLFWSIEDENPDEWVTSVFLQRAGAHHCWRRFDCGMVEFLIGGVEGHLPTARELIGSRSGGTRWSRLRDWEHDFGHPPSAVFDDFVPTGGQWPVDGRRTRSGSLIPLRKFGHSGGDQAHLSRTGVQRPLIELDESLTTIRLHGGSQDPGISYALSGAAELESEVSPGTVGLELLCDGRPIASATIEQANPRPALLDVEVLVAAGAPAAAVQLRVVAENSAEPVIVRHVYLSAKGTLGN
ncbi:hypothetical protein ACFXPS_41820 [Nocardia sp. NPDC059091]|uniref:hypothetical protein n=1 Tax=unclassified Nocardia TaxID=2637762 RepID=UPI0036ACB2E6